MNNTVALIAEVVILIFNLLIFMELTVLKRDNALSKAVMYIGTGVMMAAFSLCTFVYKQPEMLSSFLCITVPSALLFFAMSKYKDTRFFVTFCFLDTMTLAVTFFSRAMEVMFGMIYGVIAYVLVCVFMAIVYFECKPYFRRYRELLDAVNDGWLIMAVSTFLIYVLMIFSASYPKPLIERTEYIPGYFLLCITLVSIYAFYVISVFGKKKLYELNIRLKQEQHWHNIAYVDALTGLKNRMAYIERINELERSDNKNDKMYAVMIDLDNFKAINDTFGHHVGDDTLIKASAYLSEVFSADSYEIFRIGGDEFAVLAVDVDSSDLKSIIDNIGGEIYADRVGCTISVGYSEIKLFQNNSVENAFIRADSAMYDMKSKKKAVYTK